MDVGDNITMDGLKYKIVGMGWSPSVGDYFTARPIIKGKVIYELGIKIIPKKKKKE